ncbi:MAG: hypothetical protein JF616_07715 [Fibrobacteres bacterium]|nr:hypothetical protein [Fibrobacterota bacterium]
MPCTLSHRRSENPAQTASTTGFRPRLGGFLVSLALIAAAGAQASASKGSSGSKHDAAKPRQTARATAPAPQSESKGPRLDSARVHTLYVEGEFDQAINVLEANLRDTRQYNHNDSVFIYKHLGVMYAASDATREKGRYYMHRLLLVEPTAKIMDMYASDMIYMIFKNIQEEYAETHEHSAQPDSGDAMLRVSGRPHEPESHEPAAAREEPKKSGSGYVWLGAAAVAVAASAATLYYLAEEKPKVVVQDHQPQ